MSKPPSSDVNHPQQLPITTFDIVKDKVQKKSNEIIGFIGKHKVAVAVLALPSLPFIVVAAAIMTIATVVFSPAIAYYAFKSNKEKEEYKQKIKKLPVTSSKESDGGSKKEAQESAARRANDIAANYIAENKYSPNASKPGGKAGPNDGAESAPKKAGPAEAHAVDSASKGLERLRNRKYPMKGVHDKEDPEKVREFCLKHPEFYESPTQELQKEYNIMMGTILEKYPLFTDEQILEVHQEETRDGIQWVDNHALVQQQGGKGCTAAVTAMLIRDHGLIPKHELNKRSASDEDVIIKDLNAAGLGCIKKTPKDIEELRQDIIKGGSAIVSLTGGKPGDKGSIGSHVIIIDEISEASSGYKMKIRDPWHGWSITITAEAFLQQWVSDKNIYQAKLKVDDAILKRDLKGNA